MLLLLLPLRPATTMQFTCIRTPLLFGPDEQTVHVECAALISKGRAALARWGWQDNLGNTTRLLSTKLEVAPIPGFFGEVRCL
jgi:hypothetical protein